jgi:hypothetical protein
VEVIDVARWQIYTSSDLPEAVTSVTLPYDIVVESRWDSKGENACGVVSEAFELQRLDRDLRTIRHKPLMLVMALYEPRLPGVYLSHSRLFASSHFLLTLCLDIRQQSAVVRSGSAMNDWIALPIVTRVVSPKCHRVRAINTILKR